MLYVSVEEFKTCLVPSLTPLLASNAANMTINTIEKSAVSHFLVSYFPFPNFPFLLLVTPLLLKTTASHVPLNNDHV